MQRFKRQFQRHLAGRYAGRVILVSFGLATCTLASAAGPYFAVTADLEIQKVLLSGGAVAPQVLQPGQRSQVTFVFQPDVEMAHPPDLQLEGRGWKNALIRTTFAAPLNLVFEAGQVSQSDGLLKIDHDPLGDRDYSLRARLHRSGPAIIDSARQEYRALQFFWMQRGHTDQGRPLRELIAQIPKLPDARMLIKYRTAPGSESWHTAQHHPSISMAFEISNVQLIEHVESQEDSH